jgi:hypothetical protein
MSRFDRRLKGVGLRPGEATCNITSQRSNYAGMQWNRQTNNNLGVQNQSNVHQSNVHQSNVQSASYSANLGSTFIPSVTNNEAALSLEEKNLKLAAVEKSAPTAEMRLITRHEIRLNNLEASVLTNKDLGCLTNNKLQEGVFDNTLNTLESNFMSKVTQMEVQCKNYTNSCNTELHQKINYLQSIITEVINDNNLLKSELEFLKNNDTEKVRLIVQDKEDKDDSNSESSSEIDDDIKKVVSDAINGSILKMDN